MRSGVDALVIRRIRVVVDTALSNTAVPGTTARPASAFDAALHGIFLEDINHLRLAGLPFTWELS